MTADAPPPEATPPAPGPTTTPATEAPAPPTTEESSAASTANSIDLAAPPTEAELHPSFDCATATDWSARQVCGDAALAALDRRMAVLYARRMAASSSDGAVQLRNEQRAWVARRKSCEITGEADCLRDAYTARLAELSGPAEGDASAPAATPSEPSPTTSGDIAQARSAAAAARLCIGRGDLDCAQVQLTELLRLQPNRPDARRLLDQIRDQRQRASRDGDGDER